MKIRSHVFLLCTVHVDRRATITRVMSLNTKIRTRPRVEMELGLWSKHQPSQWPYDGPSWIPKHSHRNNHKRILHTPSQVSKKHVVHADPHPSRRFSLFSLSRKATVLLRYTPRGVHSLSCTVAIGTHRSNPSRTWSRLLTSAPLAIRWLTRSKSPMLQALWSSGGWNSRKLKITNRPDPIRLTER